LSGEPHPFWTFPPPLNHTKTATRLAKRANESRHPSQGIQADEQTSRCATSAQRDRNRLAATTRARSQRSGLASCDCYFRPTTSYSRPLTESYTADHRGPVTRSKYSSNC